MELLKTEKQEKNELSDEKTSLVRALEDRQLEVDQVVHNLKMSQTDLEKCNNEKIIESDHKGELKNKITLLIQEKLNIESEFRTTAEKLANMESEKEELNKQKIKND